MEYRVELKKRLLAAFPSLGLAGYLVGMTDKQAPPDVNESYGKSPLNTPYWDNIEIAYINKDNNQVKYTFPNDPLVSVQMHKKVTVTEVFGGSSIIETSGVSEAQFNIRGVLWNGQLEYPEDQLVDLLEVFREGLEIEVISSRFFSMLNISTLFIESISLPASEGMADSQPFIITCREVKPVVLELYENNPLRSLRVAGSILSRAGE